MLETEVRIGDTENMTDVSALKSEIGNIALVNMTNGESVRVDDSISMTDSKLIETKVETKYSDIMTDG